MLFNEAPEAIKSAGVEALLIDQVTLAGGTIADFLNLPFITVCNALLTGKLGYPIFYILGYSKNGGYFYVTS